MTDWIEAAHFNDLDACDPDEVTARTGCRYDPETREYRVDVWGRTYGIDLDRQTLSSPAGAPESHQGFIFLFIFFYLIKGGSPLTGRLISEKDLPGGPGFFRGPHTLPTDWITDRAGNDAAGFCTCCERLGGIRVAMADAAYTFEITPTVPVTVLFWDGDEDFPCEAKLLFDASIENDLPLDIVFALAVEVCHAFKSMAD